MFKLFKKKKKEKITIEMTAMDELAPSLESVVLNKSCKTCSNIIFSGGKIPSCTCKEGMFGYSKYPPEIPEECNGNYYVPRTKLYNLPTGL